METNDGIVIYTFAEAVTNAIELSKKYKRNYAVVITQHGYSVIGARYAKRNWDKLQIEYVTDIQK